MDYLIYSIEDDKDIAHILNVMVDKQGYQIKTFFDGKSFFDNFNKQKPNMILLDINLPDINGLEILKKLRSNPKNDDIEIIIISANRLVIDKVDGLDLGADDYIEKPFDILELMSRINAHVRRFKRNQIINIGNITIDKNAHLVKKNQDVIQLTNKEFDVLVYLCENKGNVVSRDQILDAIWGQGAYESRTIDMHIKSLRKKLDDNDLIQTVYGIGYRVRT